MLLNACTVHAIKVNTHVHVINAYLAQLVKSFHFVQMGVGSTCVGMFCLYLKERAVINRFSWLVHELGHAQVFV